MIGIDMYMTLKFLNDYQYVNINIIIIRIVHEIQRQKYNKSKTQETKHAK